MDVWGLIEKLVMSILCIIMLVEAPIIILTAESRSTEGLLGMTMIAVVWLLIKKIGGK